MKIRAFALFVAGIGVLSQGPAADPRRVQVQAQPGVSQVQVNTVPASTGAVVVQPSTSTTVVPAPAAVAPAPAVVAPAAAAPVNIQVNEKDEHADRPGGEFDIQLGKAMFTGSSKDYLDDSFSI